MKHPYFRCSKSFNIAALTAVVGLNCYATGAPVTLQQPTATFSQSFAGDFSIARTINGTTADGLGWAVSAGLPGNITSHTAAFETASDIGFAGGSLLTFTLDHSFSGPFPLHTLGRFRFSVTTDNRSLFADGLASGGDVTANWIVLNPNSFSSANGATLTKLADLSLLASGLAPLTDVYTITATTALTGITGIRLEALEDPSLPFNGPGRNPENGNFVLSEFSVNIIAVPEPNSMTLLFIGGLTLLRARRARK